MFTDSEGRLKPAWAFVVSAMLACAAFVVTGYLAAAVAGEHVLWFEVIFRPLLVLSLLAGFSWLLTIANHVESHHIAAQGLPLSAGWAEQFCLGSVIATLLVVAGVIPIAILGRLTFRTTFSAHNLARAALVVLVVVAGALAEELMFRGYPFQRLVEAIGAAGAILVFSVLFGVVHLLNPGASIWGLINTIVIGVFLAIAYLRTRALWLPWGFHFAWNLMLGLILGLPVSGFRVFNVIVHGTTSGPKWLTGGSYGLEAAAPGAFAIAIGLLIVWLVSLKPLALSPEMTAECNELRPHVSDSSN
jgi:membrane protease YdiL (CAAX protease family)